MRGGNRRGIHAFITRRLGGLTVGFSDATVPVQAIPSMRLCPMKVSIIGYLAVELAVKSVAAVVFACIVTALTSLSRRFVPGFLCGCGVLLISYFIADADTVRYGQWKYINLWSFYDTDLLLSRYRAPNVASFPVTLTFLALLVFIFAVILAFVLHYRVFVGVKRAYRTIELRSFLRRLTRFAIPDKSNKRNRLRVLRSGTLLLNEQRKRLWLIPLFIILLALRCFDASGYFGRTDYSTYTRLYKEYLGKIGGAYTAEKAEYLQDEYRRCAEIIGSYSQKTDFFMSGEYPTDEYLRASTEYSAAKAKTEVLSTLLAKSALLQSLSSRGVTGSFIDEPDLNRFIYRGVDWYLVALVWIVGISAFTAERGRASSSPSLLLVRTTPLGRKNTLTAKCNLALIYSAVGYITFRSVDIIFYLLTFDVPPSGTLLVSLTGYGSAPKWVTLGQYFVFALTAGLAGAVLICLLCCSVSCLVSSVLPAYTVSAAAVFVPGLMISVLNIKHPLAPQTFIFSVR